MTHRQPKDLDDVRAALAAGKMEMLRPHGDWVRCRPRTRNLTNSEKASVTVIMENQVEAYVGTESARFGFPDVRIAL